VRVQGMKITIAIGLLLVAVGCSVTLDIYGIVGTDEVYTGTTTGNGESGTMTLANGKGTSCLGERIGTKTSGHGLLTCNDGMRVLIQYTTVSLRTGYGFGNTSDGRPVKFTFGMDRAESAKYLGQMPAQAAEAPGQPPAPGAAAQPARIATGTGFFITRQGHLLTNAHVIEDCKSVSVTPLGGAATPASIVSSDRTNDLAVLSTGSAPRAVAALRGQPVRQGEAVVAYGFPLSGALSSGGVTTSGSISALAGMRDDTRFLQMSAPVQPGNSGGPLVDMTGAVVGVVSSRLGGRGAQAAQNVNFAVKTEVVRTFLAAVGVTPETSSGARELRTPDVVERVRAFTVFVECKL
jgi:S1-C subfamily serine protease